MLLQRKIIIELLLSIDMVRPNEESIEKGNYSIFTIAQLRDRMVMILDIVL
jgi:hypothetical protein